MAKKDRFEDDFSSGTTTGSSTASGLKDRASGLGSTASSQIDNSPLIAVGAGIALGAVLGAVLPVSTKERELLEPLGRKLNDKSTAAIDRSRAMAKQKFDEMAGDKVREFLGGNSTSANA